MLQIYNTIRTLVEEEVHDGQIGLKAVFQGKDLEIRLFQIQIRKDRIRTLRMDYFSKIIHLRFTLIILRQAQIHLDAGLFYKEPYQSKVQVKKTFMTCFKNGEQFILIVIEIC